LGSALTHPSITTDYSEALLEFITAPSCSIEAVLKELEDLHRFTYHQIEGRASLGQQHALPAWR
jgi:glutamate--cysteine ligase